MTGLGVGVPTGTLLVLDLLAAALTAAAWLGAGAAASARREALAAGLFAAALTATLLQVGTVAALAAAGWWFVADRVTIGLPLLLVAAGVAVLLIRPRLRPAALRERLRPARSHAALLTAGYAAAAGPVVVLLVGYRGTVLAKWSVALFTVAAVALAALVTCRAMLPPRSPWRRRADAGGFGAAVCVALLGAGLLVGGASGGGVPGRGGPGDRASGDRAAIDLGGGPPPARPAAAAIPVTALRGPAEPAPGGQVRSHTLTARTGEVTLASGRRIEAWTFDGQVPGPALLARQGDLIEVTLRNLDIEDGVTLHWHGYDVPPGEDGVPGLTQAAVMPGEEFGYRFRADQAGTYWYHTHSVSDRGVRMGLYGTLVVTPRAPEPAGVDLTLPVHTFGGVTVLGDRDLPGEQAVPAGSPVRLRLVNTDDTPHRFTLDGAPYRLAAVDGRDLHQPGQLAEVTLRLAAGGRYDLVFTMPAAPVTLATGGSLSLRLAPAAGSGADPAGTHSAPLRPAGWPELDLLAYGAPAATDLHPGTAFDRDFTLVLDRGLAMVEGSPRYAHTVNGRGFPGVPTQLVAEGDAVRFTVVNRSLETHPWHLHGHAVLVLSRDGRPVTGSPLWLDTFDVRPGEVWEVAFLADNPGLWMNHCHNLPHAHEGMMLHLAYEGVAAAGHH